MTPTDLPVYALASQGNASEQELFPGRYSDLAAAWRSAEWRNAHYPRTSTYVIDTRTGERAPRTSVERPTFESDADIEDYYRAWDDDETTSCRTF